MNSFSISTDLILEILSRLPAKSAARFRCVSRLWASLLCRPYFKDLFLTISSAKPRLLFAIHEKDEEGEAGFWSFFSLPQLQNSYEESSPTLVGSSVCGSILLISFSLLCLRLWDEDAIYLKDDVDADTIIELHVWVQEDVEKQEWSKYGYTVNNDKFFSRRYVSVVGVTACGEIVFAMCEYTCEKPFYVFYFNSEKNTLPRVEIQGLGEKFKRERYVLTFVNHVEDLNVHDLKLLKSVQAPFAELEDSEYDWSD